MKLFKTELEKITDLIQSRIHNASNIHCIDTKNNFLRGSLHTFKYILPSQKGEQTEDRIVRAYVHDDRIDLYDTDDLLLSVIGETHRSLCLGFSVSGFIAILLTITICGLALWRDLPIPDILGNALTVILGFYFGQASNQSIQRKSD